MRNVDTPQLIFLRAAAFACAYVPTYLLPHVVTAYLQTDGLSEGQAGFLVMIENGSLAGANLCAFMLSPKARRRLLLAGSVLAVVANVSCVPQMPLALLAALRAVSGAVFGLGGFVAAQQVAVSANPARVFGFANGALALLGGALLWLVPQLAGSSSAQVFFTLAAIVAVLAIVTAIPSATAESDGSEVAKDSNSASLVGNLVFPTLIVTTVLLFSPLGGLYDFAAYQGLHLGMSSAAVGLALGWTTVTGLFGGPAAGWLCTHRGLRLPMLISVVLAAATCAVVGLARNPLEFVLAFCLFGITYMFAMTTIASIGASADPTGRAAALLVGCQILAVAAGSLFVGVLLERQQALLIWTAGGLLCLIAAVPAAWAVRYRAGRMRRGQVSETHHERGARIRP